MCYWNVKTHFLEQKSTYKVWPILPPNAGFFSVKDHLVSTKVIIQTKFFGKLSKTRTVSALNPNEPPFPRGVCSWMMLQPSTMPRAAVALRSANCYSESIRNWTFRHHAALQKMVLWRLPFLKLTCPHMFPENWWLKDEVSFPDGLFSVSGRVPCFFGILKCFRGPILYAPKVWLILPRCHIEISQFSWLRGWNSFFSAKAKRSLDFKIWRFAQHGGMFAKQQASKLQETTPSPK